MAVLSKIFSGSRMAATGNGCAVHTFLMRKGEGGKLSGDSQVYRAPTSYLSRELPVGQDYRWPQCSVVYPKKSEFGYYTTKH
jgi:hypothetical protein